MFSFQIEIILFTKLNYKINKSVDDINTAFLLLPLIVSSLLITDYAYIQSMEFTEYTDRLFSCKIDHLVKD